MAKRALVNAAQYEAAYKLSIDDPESFWAEQGKRLEWIKPYNKVKDVDYTGEVRIRWYYDGTLNVSANCIDRHLAKRANQTAIIVGGRRPRTTRRSPMRSCTSRSAASPM